MSEQEQQMLKLENLILRLNTIAQQRKGHMDAVWQLEDEGEKLRLELIQMMNKGCLRGKS